VCFLFVGRVCDSQSKISDYELVGVIGSGGYGCVYEVNRRTMDKRSYALKIVKLLDRYYFVLYKIIDRNYVVHGDWMTGAKQKRLKCCAGGKLFENHREN